jgi:hypothetical protein
MYCKENNLIFNCRKTAFVHSGKPLIVFLLLNVSSQEEFLPSWSNFIILLQRLSAHYYIM